MGDTSLEMSPVEYAARVENFQGRVSWVREARRLIETVDTKSSVLSRCRVLDFGCGTGKLCRMLAGQGASVVGVDPSDEMLRRAEECEIGFVRPARPAYVRLDDRLPDHLGTFDVIFCLHVLGHTDDVAETLGMLSGALADKGRIVVLNPNLTHTLLRMPYNWLRGFKADPTIRHRFTLSGLENHARQASLRAEWAYMTGERFLGASSMMAASLVHA
ncbi:MAG: class I SAM-dependent methyltransferase [Aquamicrobium sp.]|uniref:class I SAM-dependent methyltransferase n=1 Tax=Aquamicrobium sp. TaxID=1872579 RepID=UPI00349E5EFE|nr:class I SAM-dependent methyltransferase [Aquamicrobium sp.]